MPKIHKIALTGGPCAGKTTAIERLKDLLICKGYIVLTVPEASTLNITNGVRFYPELLEDFQFAITNTQKHNENSFFNYAKRLVEVKNQDVIVLLDRGLPDGSVYISEQAFEELLENVGIPGKAKLYERYDAVLFLRTAAIGASDFYKNTEYRFENKKEAIDVDLKTEKAWIDHPNFYKFDNENKSFEKKMREVVDTVCNIIEIPITMKSPLKYIIDFSLKDIPKELKVMRLKVQKTFLKPSMHNQLGNALGEVDPQDQPEYSFMRRIESENMSSYCLKTVSYEHNQVIERKQHFDKRQYKSHDIFADETRNKIYQTRFLFTIGEYKYQICCYLGDEGASLRNSSQEKDLCEILKEVRYSVKVPEENADYKPLAILNVYPPLNSAKEDFTPPSFFKVKKEVTKDFRFTSHFLSLKNKGLTYNVPYKADIKNVSCSLVKGIPDMN